jgi:hypothetical protein
VRIERDITCDGDSLEGNLNTTHAQTSNDAVHMWMPQLTLTKKLPKLRCIIPAHMGGNGARRAWPVTGDVTTHARHAKRPTRQSAQLRVSDKAKERANWLATFCKNRKSRQHVDGNLQKLTQKSGQLEDFQDQQSRKTHHKAASASSSMQALDASGISADTFMPQGIGCYVPAQSQGRACKRCTE